MPHDHDFYNFCAGFTLCWAMGQFLHYVMRDILRNTDATVLMRAALRWTWIGVQVLVLGVAWLTFPPFLIGLLFEAVLVNPFRANWQETPRYPMLQGWAVGVIFLKIWTK